MNPSIVYLPGLNGLRAIAAFAVIISHITLSLNHFGLKTKLFGVNMYGTILGWNLAGYGVTLFFTLSGFLITFLILKEKETAKLNIKHFYIRRILRIWPLYYLYFFICLATILCFGISFNKESIPYYIFLTPNIPFIIHTTLPFLAHYWSLGVEEQFYLFFPQIARYSNKKLFKISVLILVLFLFVKLIFWVLVKKYNIPIPYLAITVTRFQTIIIGVIGAILYYNRNQLFVLLTTHKLTQMIAWTCILLMAMNRFHIGSVINDELASAVSLCLIMGQVTKRNRLINLENKVCDFIGKISYGMYVIHPLLIFYFAKIFGQFKSDEITNHLLLYFLITSTTILLAYLSYELFEKKFLKLKTRYSPVRSSGTNTKMPGAI